MLLMLQRSLDAIRGRRAPEPQPDPLPANPKADCGCSLLMIEVFDGHQLGCDDNLPRAVYTVPGYEVPRHQVGGVEMPVGSPHSVDLDRRWCDLTGYTEQATESVTIGRCWPGLRIIACAIEDEGTWYWWADTYPDGTTSTTGKLAELAAGTAKDVPGVIDVVEQVVTDHVAQLVGEITDAADAIAEARAAARAKDLI